MCLEIIFEWLNSLLWAKMQFRWSSHNYGYNFLYKQWGGTSTSISVIALAITFTILMRSKLRRHCFFNYSHYSHFHSLNNSWNKYLVTPPLLIILELYLLIFGFLIVAYVLWSVMKQVFDHYTTINNSKLCLLNAGFHKCLHVVTNNEMFCCCQYGKKNK